MPPPDFALKQLQKYGWTPGQGLGLNQDGMAEPLQLGLKLNQKGLGQDELDKKKSGWGNQWWDSIFNKTLKSLDVTMGDSHEEVNLISCPILSSMTLRSHPFFLCVGCHQSLKVVKKSVTKMKTSDKGNGKTIAAMTRSSEVASRMGLGVEFQSFVSSTNSSMVMAEQDKDDDDDSQYCMPITDQELFKACGGRTARKGARGASQKGKLFRTLGTGAWLKGEDSSSEEDDERLKNIQSVLESMSGSSLGTVSTAESSKARRNEEVTKKKSKKRKSENESERPTKKKKKSEKTLESEEDQESLKSTTIDKEKPKKDKKTKKANKKAKKKSSSSD
jgi:hypothetical protein